VKQWEYLALKPPTLVIGEMQVQGVVIKNGERANGFLDKLSIEIMTRDIEHRSTPTHHEGIMSQLVNQRVNLGLRVLTAELPEQAGL